MPEAEEERAEYVHVFTIVPLPGVSDEDLERHLIDEVLPNFNVTHRPIGHVELQHSLLKATSDDDRLDRYVWEIRLRFRQRVKAPDQDALDKMDGLVRSGLESFGLAVSMTALQEIQVATTS